MKNESVHEKFLTTQLENKARLCRMRKIQHHLWTGAFKINKHSKLAALRRLSIQNND